MVRKPDPSKKDCLLPSGTGRPHRHKKKMSDPDEGENNAHQITWQMNDELMDDGPNDVEVDMDLLRALEESQRLFQEEEKRRYDQARLQQEKERAQKKMDLEKERAEETSLRFGLVRSRLRLMNQPPDPIVTSLLALIDWECTPIFERPLHPPLFDRGAIHDWIAKRCLSKKTVFAVLLELSML